MLRIFCLLACLAFLAWHNPLDSNGLSSFNALDTPAYRRSSAMARNIRHSFAIKSGATASFLRSVLRKIRKVINIMRPHPVWTLRCYVSFETDYRYTYSLLRYLAPARVHGVPVCILDVRSSRMLIFFLAIVALTVKKPPKPPEDGLKAVNTSILESNKFNDRFGLLNAVPTDGVVCWRSRQTSASTQSFSSF